MMRESDRRLEDRFVELERQSLERRLTVSPSEAFDAVTPKDTPAPSAPPKPRRSDPWFDSEAPKSEGGIDLSAAGEGGKPPRAKRERAIVAEWWTMGQNALMDGALELTVQSFEPEHPGAQATHNGASRVPTLRHQQQQGVRIIMGHSLCAVLLAKASYMPTPLCASCLQAACLTLGVPHADAGKALAAITSAQQRREDPDASSMLALICHCVRSPEQHGAGKWWGAQHAPGAGQLSPNQRLAVFGHALQLVVEDLLTGTTEV